MLRALLGRLEMEVRKQLHLRPTVRELEPYLVAKELLFRAPPLTPELVLAIKRISPQFHLGMDEASRRFWELNQNGLCWGEYEALKPFLQRLPDPPRRVLDIGPGLGRSAIFFKKVAGWETVPFDLYEGAGSSTKYTKAGRRFADSFCGDFEALETVLRHNGIENCAIVDARTLDASLTGLPGAYDFVYSFFAVGFHWSIAYFLDEILALMHDSSIAAFTLHDRVADLAPLSRLPHAVVEFRRSSPRGRWSRLLVLSKSEEAVRQA